MTRRVQAALTLLGAVALMIWLFLDRPVNRPKPPSDLEVADAWLQCIDCQGPFLKRIGNMSSRNRDTVTQFLLSALTRGPDNTRVRRFDLDLERAWQADSLYRARTNLPPDSLRDEFFTRYHRGFVVRWCSRAAIALGVIGSPPALAALDSLLQVTPTSKEDSIVHRHAESVRADTGRSVLAHF